MNEVFVWGELFGELFLTIFIDLEVCPTERFRYVGCFEWLEVQQ